MPAGARMMSAMGKEWKEKFVFKEKEPITAKMLEEKFRTYIDDPKLDPDLKAKAELELKRLNEAVEKAEKSTARFKQLEATKNPVTFSPKVSRYMTSVGSAILLIL